MNMDVMGRKENMYGRGKVNQPARMASSCCSTTKKRQVRSTRKKDEKKEEDQEGNPDKISNADWEEGKSHV